MRNSRRPSGETSSWKGCSRSNNRGYPCTWSHQGLSIGSNNKVRSLTFSLLEEKRIKSCWRQTFVVGDAFSVFFSCCKTAERKSRLTFFVVVGREYLLHHSWKVFPFFQCLELDWPWTRAHRLSLKGTGSKVQAHRHGLKDVGSKARAQRHWLKALKNSITHENRCIFFNYVSELFGRLYKA